jgi:hypothetical protein
MQTSLYFAVPAVSANTVKEKGMKWPHGGVPSLGLVLSARKSKIQLEASIIWMVAAIATTFVTPRSRYMSYPQHRSGENRA